MATNDHTYDYSNFSKKYHSKYQKRSVESIIEKARALWNDKEMQEAHARLSAIPVVVLVDRIGGTAINSSVNNECKCERFNIGIIVDNERQRVYHKFY